MSLYVPEILRVMEIESGRKLLGQTLATRDTNGGYTNDPDDPGGETNWGFTKSTLARLAPKLDVKKLTLLQAHDLYLQHFYKKSGAELISTYSIAVSTLTFEYAVHRGPETAAKLVQELLNLNNNNGKLWPELKVDGIVGRRTLDNIKAYAHRRGNRSGELVFLLQFSSAIIDYYRQRVTAKPSQEKYYYGWCYRAARDHMRFLSEIK